MKKILFVFPYAIVGGIETLFATLLKNLPKEFEYHTLLPRGLNKEWVDKNIPRPVYYSTQSFKNDLSKKIDAINPHLIVGALNHNLSLAKKECVRKYPVVETSHNVLSSSIHSIDLMKDWIVHVVCVSRSVQKHISVSYKGPSSVILTGIDTNKFRPLKNLNQTVKNYAYFGRLSEGDKYLKKLFKTFSLMPDLTLNVYGSAINAKEQRNYEILASTEFKKAHIVFKGFVTNPELHMPSNDVVVIRSEAEGFCNTAAEALASGVPLVAYNFGGVLDHVPQLSCLIAQTQFEFDLNVKLVKDYDLRMKLRENGLKFIQNECNADLMSKQYFELFKKLTEDKIEIKSKVVDKTNVIAFCTCFSDSILHSMEEYVSKTLVLPHNKPDQKLDYEGHKIVANCASFVYDDIIKNLSIRNDVYAMYHTGFCCFSFSMFTHEERAVLQSMLDLQKAGYIKKIGFINEGSAKFYSRLGYRTCWTPNIPMKFIGSDKSKLDGIHIGVFTTSTNLKNTVTAVSCALAIPNAIVHTTYAVEPNPGLDKSRIVVHGKQTKNGILELLGKMHVTLMLSFSESYGLLVTQSWAMGTPCIVGPACKPLLSPELKGLYVERFDDAHEIINAILYCLNTDLRPFLRSRIEELRSLGIQKREEFLS